MRSSALRAAGHAPGPARRDRDGLAGVPGGARIDAVDARAAAVAWDRLARALLVAAGLLVAAAPLLPLWGMTLVSIQYPDGLRLVVYAGRIAGDIAEINALNHYIGMAPIADGFFPELRVLPALLLATAGACLFAALFRRWWVALLPLGAMLATAGYGLSSMRRRLYAFGHDLDPAAAIDIEPFTPEMFGQSVIAQFGVYSYFSWGFWLPLIAGGLVALVLWRDLRARMDPVPPADEV